jgi:hypothetical protein
MNVFQLIGIISTTLLGLLGVNAAITLADDYYKLYRAKRLASNVKLSTRRELIKLREQIDRNLARLE